MRVLLHPPDQATDGARRFDGAIVRSNARPRKACGHECRRAQRFPRQLRNHAQMAVAARYAA